MPLIPQYQISKKDKQSYTIVWAQLYVGFCIHPQRPQTDESLCKKRKYRKRVENTRERRAKKKKYIHNMDAQRKSTRWRVFLVSAELDFKNRFAIVHLLPLLCVAQSSRLFRMYTRFHVCFDSQYVHSHYFLWCVYFSIHQEFINITVTRCFFHSRIILIDQTLQVQNAHKCNK